MNNHILTDEKYKVAATRKEKHLVSVLNALGRTARLLLGAGGLQPCHCRTSRRLLRLQVKFGCLSLLSWLRCAQLLTWLLTFVHRVYGNDGMTDVYKLLCSHYIQPLLHLFWGG